MLRNLTRPNTFAGAGKFGRTMLGSSLRRATFASQGHFYDILQLDEMRSDLRLNIEKFADDEVKPLRESMDTEDVFPAHMWKRLGDMGLLGITVELSLIHI